MATKRSDEEVIDQKDGTACKKPKIASSENEYLEKRQVLLGKEKELTKLRDEVSSLRQSLPWRKLSKTYKFEGMDGEKVSLKDLFKGKSQLIVQHFMFGPGWKAGCKSCSFMADHLTGSVPHLGARDVAFVAVVRSPLNDEFKAFNNRMGWNIDFYSSHGSDFNYDFQVAYKESEFKEKGYLPHNYVGKKPFFMEDWPGISVFALKEDDADTVFHTYSTYDRGLDPFITAYQLLDIVPNGRGEENPPNGFPMYWLKHHDDY